MLKTPGGRPPHPRPSARTGRRLAALLTVPVLLLAGACGTDDSDEGGTKVSGTFGKQPKVTVPEDAKAPEETSVSLVTEGKGAKAGKGDFVRMDVFARMTANDQELINTWKRQGDSKDGARTQMVAELGADQQVLPAKVTDAVVGKKAGSRIIVEGTAGSVIGEQLNPQAGIDKSDGMVWVVDVVDSAKADKKAEAKGDQAEVNEGLPEVKAGDKKAATITVPKGEKAPKGLEEQVLIKGDGPEVKAGEGLIAQYTGVKWEDGKKFDSSWDHGGATGFQIGTGSVVKGWDQGLVGKKVGDRVLLVIPPKLAYGSNPQSELAKNTLVFVVDIVGKV